MSEQQRNAPRVPLDKDFEIFFNGFSLEVPARNISIGGLCLDFSGLDGLKSGDICRVTISDDFEVNAKVVGKTLSTIHLQFIGGAERDINSYIDQLT
ncbi:MAG: PilZ domain-containing protein [Candidatus Symbiobacter sp.]|nr:PilZ domain-containing protein [Candidatus Symbiobacter sp.]